jgi:hypothetical protein
MYKAVYSHGEWVYYRGDKVITKEEYEKKFPPKNWDPSQGSPFTCGDVDDFVHERDPVTGRQGTRYYPQLARFPGDKTACFDHVNRAAEAAKRRGYNVER